MSLSSSVLGFIKWLVVPLILLTDVAIAQVPCISGYVRDDQGNVVADADLDFDDALTGQRMYTPNDNTDETGFYRVCILPGLYNITFSPPPGTHLMSKRYLNYSLEQSQVLNVNLDRGYVISGIVRNSYSSPISGVDLDVDSLGGGRVFTADDNSDTTGLYWVVVPPGQYRVRYTPPIGSRYQGLQIDSLFVGGDTTVDIILQEGVSVSGRVADPSGQGLVDIEFDLRELSTGEKIFVPFNKTDSLGNYSVVTSTGIFDARFSPPIGSRYVGVQLDTFAIAGDLTWDQILESGFIVNCAVHDSTGAPIADADLDLTEVNTGKRIFLPHDKTDMNGLMSTAVLPATYTIRVDPPDGTIFDHLTADSVNILSDTSLYFVLHEIDRVNFVGRIVNSAGLGLSGIEVGLTIPATGNPITINHNTTDASGYFDVDVPIGNFNLYLSPERGSRYVGRRFDNVLFEHDTTWGDAVLESGVVFSARVFDNNGRPVQAVDFDFVRNGSAVFSPHDLTDSIGTMQTALLPGEYDLQLRPSQGSNLDTKLIAGYNIQTDTSEVFFLSSGDDEIPRNFILGQNFPNPFNKNTSISYTLLKGSDVAISIYNAVGQHIVTKKIGYQRLGSYMMQWDGTDSKGRGVSSGLYFYKIMTSYGKATKKMLFIQ